MEIQELFEERVSRISLRSNDVWIGITVFGELVLEEFIDKVVDGCE